MLKISIVLFSMCLVNTVLYIFVPFPSVMYNCGIKSVITYLCLDEIFEILRAKRLHW
jgi:hypothetical protein